MNDSKWTRQEAADVTVVVLGGGRGTRLDPLTRMRSKPAVPLAGKYRLIDVPLSNAIHSGMERIFVLTQFNSVSLHRHLQATYKFAPFSRGFVEVLAAQQTPKGENWYQGTADAVRRNLEFILELRAKRVLILAGDHLYRFDYRLMLRDHIRNDAKITISVLPCSEQEIGEFGAVRVDTNGAVVEFREKPQTVAAREGLALSAPMLAERGFPADKPYVASMGIYLFDVDVLADCLAATDDDFGKDVLPKAIARHRVQSHFFDGYWRDIGTIRAFFDAHMDLLQPSPPFDFYDPEWVIYTRPRYLPGSRITGTEISMTIMADGAVLKDSKIERSVVGIRAWMHAATVKNTLVMGADEDAPDAPPGAPRIGIDEGSVIENAIIDKNVRIGRNVRLTNAAGVREAEGDGWVIRSGIIVVRKNAIIPDGTIV